MERGIVSRLAAVRNGAAAGCAAALMALAALAAGCSPDGPEPQQPGDTPEGYARVEVKLKVKGAPEYETRAQYFPEEKIDNVNLFWFSDNDGNGRIDDADSLVERRYFDYGTRQEIFLKRGSVYYVYAVANLADIHCSNGNLATYFDDVATYADLKGKYLLNPDRPVDKVDKIVMAADGVTTLRLPDNPGPNELITPEIKLERIPAKFVINIYNRVAGRDDPRVISHVNPVSMTGVDFIRGSYMLSRTDPKEDFSEASGYTGDIYFQPRSVSLVADGMEQTVEYPVEGSGKWYTKQTFEIFALENRKGSVPEIIGYSIPLVYTDPRMQDVYGRYELAPDDATHLRINSLVSQDAPEEVRGKVLLTWVHAGKGRNSITGTDDITNFDVERNAVYNFNVVINGIDNVTIDSRRDYLDQMIIFELPNAADRIDAHYVDMPGYISGNAKGMVKIQSGTMVGEEWVPMKDTDRDEDRWLRFSIYDPEHRVGGVPVTWYTPAASTSIYVDMPQSGLSKRRLLLHFNENVSIDTGTGAVKAATNANGTPVADNPPYRTAMIRVGFVDGVHTEAEYEAKAADGGESYFFQSVRQYGLKAIGVTGAYIPGQGYTQLLGVESVEETQSLYYTTAGLVPPPPYDAANQIFWQYRSGTAGNTNQTYDGMAATRAIYNDYRALAASGGVPPQRGQDNIGTATTFGVYNPFTTTNAADYCIRKNRDENGDGIISGAEVKWYLPTPVQASWLYLWRGAFMYPLNQDYRPLGGGTAGTAGYWTTNETEAAQALVSGFTGAANTTSPQPKSSRNAVRCMRDIEGGELDRMFYYGNDDSGNGHLYANLTGHLPGLISNKHVNPAENTLRRPENNNIASAFIISRWYSNGTANHPAQPTTIVGNNNSICSGYREPGYSNWFLPSERELALIYAYAELLNGLLVAAFSPDAPAYPGNSTDFHHLRTDGRHWAITNVGDNSTFWYVDFLTGASGTLQKSNNQAYARCIHYINPNTLQEP